MFSFCIVSYRLFPRIAELTRKRTTLLNVGEGLQKATFWLKLLAKQLISSKTVISIREKQMKISMKLRKYNTLDDFLTCLW